LWGIKRIQALVGIFQVKSLKKPVKAALPPSMLRHVLMLRMARRSLRPIAKRECNICGFTGWFSPLGRPARLDAQCPKCMRLERHSQLMLALDRGLLQNKPARMLRFAPERMLDQRFRARWGAYQTADLF
jgi:hypothetical protein